MAQRSRNNNVSWSTMQDKDGFPWWFEDTAS